jgi:hypothetical protein
MNKENIVVVQLAFKFFAPYGRRSFVPCSQYPDMKAHLEAVELSSHLYIL